VAGDAPDALYTYTQLKIKGLVPLDRKAAVGCVVTAYNDLVLLYDIQATKPRRGETERQRAARVATWLKTQEKWRCTHCDRVPASIGDLTNYWYKPGLCESCKEMIDWQAKEEVRLAR
jgi:hypothetical protein